MSWGARTSYAEPFTKLLPYGLVGFAWVRKRHTPLRFAGPEGGQLSHPGPGHKLLCFRSKSIVTSPRSSLTHAGLFCPFSQINSLSCFFPFIFDIVALARLTVGAREETSYLLWPGNVDKGEN